MSITEYYVDPSINANSGSGTIGSPYGDLQYALNTVTRNSTDGDRFNIKAGTAEVLAAAISLTTYGTPALGAPLVFQGYTSAQGDGGIGEINNGGANVAIIESSTIDYVAFQDMKIGNTGTAKILRLDSYCSFVNVEFHTSTANEAVLVSIGAFARCYFHDIVSASFNKGISCQIGFFTDCRFIGGWNLGRMVGCTSYSVYLRNIFTITHTGMTAAIALTGAMALVEGNSLYSSVAGTGNAILSEGSIGYVIKNNIIHGWSGTGGVGILDNATSELLINGNNFFYNNSTNISSSFKTYATLPNVSLSNAPFTNPGSGDFSIATAAKTEMESLGYPTSFVGGLTAQYLDPGAAQIQPASAGNAFLFAGLIH